MPWTRTPWVQGSVLSGETKVSPWCGVLDLANSEVESTSEPTKGTMERLIMERPITLFRVAGGDERLFR